MVAPSRKLRDDFLIHMKHRDSLPKESTVVQWLREQNEGVRAGMIGKLFDSQRISAEYAVKLVKFILARGADNPANPTYQAFVEYLRAHGQTELASPQVLAGLILENDNEDRLCVGLHSFWDAIASPFSARKAAWLCSPQSISAIVKWSYVSVGRNEKIGASVEEAIQLAEGAIGVSLAEFTRNASEWHRFDPWTVIQARYRKESVGSTMVLPLSPAAYQEFREGKIEPCKVSVHHLQRPSRHILLLACAERPTEMFGPGGNYSRYLNMALMRQIAVLSHFPGASAPQPLHALSFGATKTNELRLKTTGFGPVGTRCPESNYSIYEYELPSRPRNPFQIGIRAILDFFGDEGLAEMMVDKKNT